MLLFLIFLWSVGSASSFVFIRGAHGLGPLVVIDVAMWVGALGLHIAWRASGAARIPLGRVLWRRMVVVATMTTALTYTLISWGEEHVSATTTIIVLAMIPLIGSTIARFRPPYERLSRAAIGGLAVGLIGVLVVAGSPGGGQALGLAAIVVASAVFAACMIFAKRLAADAEGQPTIALSARHILVSAVVLTPPALLETALSPQHPGAKNLAYVAGLGVCGYGFVYIMYYWMLRRTTVAHASMTCYMQPVSGMVLAALLLGEHIGARQLAGAAIILGGVSLVDAGRRRDVRLRIGEGASLSPAGPPSSLPIPAASPRSG